MLQSMTINPKLSIA